MVATPTSSGPGEQMSEAKFGPRVDTCSHVTGSTDKSNLLQTTCHLVFKCSKIQKVIDLKMT